VTDGILSFKDASSRLPDRETAMVLVILGEDVTAATPWMKRDVLQLLADASDLFPESRMKVLGVTYGIYVRTGEDRLFIEGQQ